MCTGLKRPGRGVNLPLASSTEVKERIELHFCSLSGLSRPILRQPLLYHFTFSISGGETKLGVTEGHDSFIVSSFLPKNSESFKQHLLCRYRRSAVRKF
jgi:hypothetical protein